MIETSPKNEVRMSGCEEEIRQEAIKEWPKEMVGYIKDQKFTALKNVSRDPINRYQLSVSDKLFILNHDIDYLVHSHTVLDNRPSEKDILSQRSSKIPFLIVGTDGKTTTKIMEVL